MTTTVATAIARILKGTLPGPAGMRNGWQRKACCHTPAP